MTAVKYSITSTDNTLKLNNILFGVSNVDYGPTSSTGFWSSITPPLSGYTIYTVSAERPEPSIVCAKNDSEVIFFAKSFGGTNINTITDALAYLITLTGTTIVNMDYPNIVTSGLTLNLDASFIPSYPRTGVTCIDISGNGYNGTIINNVAFNNSIEGGEFVFNGVIGNRIDCGTNFSFISGSSNFTIECMAYPESTQNLYADIWGNHNEPYSGIVLQQNGGTPNSYSYGWAYGDGTAWVGSPYFTVSGLSYNHIVAIKNGIKHLTYVNGVKLTDDDISTSGLKPNSAFNIQIGVGYHLDSVRYFKGKVKFLRVYNRALTLTEVLQNFYTTENIVKSGLTLYLDAGNAFSYSGSGTIWNDLSGYDNSPSLGSPTYDSSNRGSFVFNGSYAINCGSNSTLKPTNGITVNTWIYCASTDSNRRYLSDWPQIAGNDRWLFLASGNNGVYWYLKTAGQAEYGTAVYTIPLNTWMNWCGTYDGAWQIFYVNGYEFSKVGRVGLLQSSASDMYIGYGPSASYHNGKISFTSIYNRALSASEVLQNFNALRSRYGL